MKEQIRQSNIEDLDIVTRRQGQRRGYVYRRGPSWFGQFRADTTERGEDGRLKRKVLTKFIAPAAGDGKVGKREAQALFYDEHLKDLHRSGPLSMKTVREFIKERFEPDVVWYLKPGGKVHYAGLLKNHVLPALGNFRLREVRPQHVQDLVRAKLDAGLSVQTARHVRNAVSAIFRHAKRLQAYSGDLPTEGVRLPESQVAEKRALTWSQVQTLAAQIGRPDETKDRKKHSAAPDLARMEGLHQQLGALVIILAQTGLRIGEALGLRWKRVNLTDKPAIVDGELVPAHTLAVPESFVLGGYGTLKSKSSRRNIPLSTETWYQFSRIQASATFTAADDPVWAALNGKPLDRHNLSNRWLKPSAKAAGVPWVSWHVLRHTAATLADQAGLSVRERQIVLGHASGSMTLHYTHADIEQVRGRMEQIGQDTKPNGTVH